MDDWDREPSVTKHENSGSRDTYPLLLVKIKSINRPALILYASDVSGIFYLYLWLVE